MIPSRAAVFVHLGGSATREQQEALATQYCVRHHLVPTTMVFHPFDALKLVKDGLVDTIVCAYLPSDRASLAAEVEAVGGHLLQARERPRQQLEIGKVFARLFDKGLTVAEIADITDMDTGEIRAELLRRGRRGK